MATERKAGTMAEFFKFTKFGHKVIGRITDYHPDRGNGDFVTLSPVLIREQPTDTVMKRYKSVAVGLSTDMKQKIKRDDSGEWVSIEYTENEPTNKGSPRKIFRVLVLELDDLKSIVNEIQTETINDVYRAPAKVVSAVAEQGEETDDLPF